VITDIRQKEGTPAATSLVVLVEGDRPEELSTIETRNKVLQYARSIGFPASGLGGVPSPYPIDEDGECDEDVVLGKKPIKCWQAEYVVNAGLK
jgi:hypothetical protein